MGSIDHGALIKVDAGSIFFGDEVGLFFEKPVFQERLEFVHLLEPGGDRLKLFTIGQDVEDLELGFVIKFLSVVFLPVSVDMQGCTEVFHGLTFNVVMRSYST